MNIYSKFILLKEFIGSDDFEKIFKNNYRNKYFENSGIEKEQFILCLSNDSLSKDQRDFVENCGKECNYNKDTRTSTEYILSLILGWLSEDFFRLFLSKIGFTSELSGTDKNREFLKPSKIKSTSDIRVYFKSDRFFDVITCYTGLCRDKLQVHLRDDKYGEIIRSNSYIAIINIKSNSLALINPKNKKTEYIPSYRPFGGKPVNTVFLEKEDFEISNIKNKLESLIQENSESTILPK